MINKRTLNRISLPLAVEFRTTYGAKEYSPGLIKNISCRGITVEACFLFILYENLDINMYFPLSGADISLNGDVLWKRQDGNICHAGIQFKKITDDVRRALADEIAYCTGRSAESILSADSTGEKMSGLFPPEKVYSKAIGL